MTPADAQIGLVNWLTLVFIGATALATSATAVAVWIQWRGTVQVEWQPEWDLGAKNRPPTMRCIITVRNYRQFAIKGLVAEVQKCPVINVTAGRHEKHASWPANQVPVSLEAEPGKAASCGISIFPDWKAMAERSAVKHRPHSSTSLRVQISLASKSRSRFKMKRHTTIPIPNSTIIEAARHTRA